MIDAWVRSVSHDFICIPRTHLGNGSSAPSPGWLNLDGSLIPFGSTATHEPTEMPKSLWARWKPLDATNKYNNEDKHLGTNGLKGKSRASTDILQLFKGNCPENHAKAGCKFNKY